MELNLPFDRLACPDCRRALKKPGRTYTPEYVIAQVAVPGGDGIKRKVAIDVLRMKIEIRGDGLARGQVKARVPCMLGDHAHDIDITDIYRAPQIHLEGNVRCAKAHKMVLEQIESWEYVDAAEFGGEILVSATFLCPQCGGDGGNASIRLKAPDMTQAQTADAIVLNLDAALVGFEAEPGAT